MDKTQERWVSPHVTEYRVKSFAFPVTSIRIVPGQRRLKSYQRIDSEYLLKVKDLSNGKIYWANMRFIVNKNDGKLSTSFTRFTGLKEKLDLKRYYEYKDSEWFSEEEEIKSILTKFNDSNNYVRIK